MKELRAEVESLMSASIVNNFSRNINVKRGARACALSSFEHESGPMGLSPICCTSKSAEKQPSMTPLKKQRLISSSEGNAIKSPRIAINDSALAGEQITADSSPSNAMSHAIIPPAVTSYALHTDLLTSPQLCAANKKSFSGIVQDRMSESQLKPQIPNEEWTLVQKKRLRNRFVGNTGKAILDSENKFKAANINVPIYIYNVSKETSVTDIKTYLLKKTNLDIRLDKMNMKSNKDYNGYIVFVPKHKLEVFLNDDFWPDGVIYRRFVDFSRNTVRPTYREMNEVKSTVNE